MRVRPLGPGRAIFGSTAMHDHQLHRLGTGDDLLEELFRGVVDPMQILDRHNPA